MATKKVGRPTESLKDYMLRVRMDKETVDKLEERYQRMGRNDKNA